MDDQEMRDAEVCVHCGLPAGRPVVPGRWTCFGCDYRQDEADCPTCGQRMHRTQYAGPWPPKVPGAARPPRQEETDG